MQKLTTLCSNGFVSFATISGGWRPLPVFRGLIQARVMYEAKMRNTDTVKASDGWFGCWRWRYKIAKSVKLQGETADINLEEAKAEMRPLHQEDIKLAMYSTWTRLLCSIRPYQIEHIC